MNLNNMSPEEIRMLYRTLDVSSKAFAQVVLGHIVTEVPQIHEEIYSLFDKNTGADALYRYIALVLFRGSGKSTLKTIKTLQDVCHRKEPMLLFLSEAEDQSIRDLVSVQDEIESNDLIKALYGDLSGKSLWNKQECEFSNGVYLGAKGWKAKIRGVKWKAQRPTKIWLDDFEGEENTGNSKIRERVSRWVEASVMPAGDRYLNLVLLGTIVHPESYLARAKDLSAFNGTKGAYYERSISGTMVNGNFVNDLSGSNPVWGNRYSRNWIQEKKDYYEETGRLRYFFQEYYNMPSKEGNVRFDLSKVQEIEDADFMRYGTITFLQSNITKTKIPIYTFTGVDVATAQTEESDKTIILTVGVTPDDKYIILDIFADKIKMPEQINEVFRSVYEYVPQHVEVETFGYQMALVHWLEKERIARNNYFVIEEFNEKSNKNTKYKQGLEPIINAGKLAYIKGCRNIDLFLQEASSWSGEEKDHDDTLDALFLAIHKSFAPAKINIDKAVESWRKKENSPSKRKASTWMTL